MVQPEPAWCLLLSQELLPAASASENSLHNSEGCIARPTDVCHHCIALVLLKYDFSCCWLSVVRDFHITSAHGGTLLIKQSERHMKSRSLVKKHPERKTG